jgi:hypothetical protein
VGADIARFSLVRSPSGDVVAASISHAAVDGFSFFHFMASWARMCRGERIMPPSHDRTVLPGMLTGSAHEAGGLERASGLFMGTPRSSALPERKDRFVIASSELKSTADEARRQAGTTLTDNDVLVAMLWQRACGGEEPSFATCPVDFRRILPGFPRMYCGCALAFATALSPQGGQPGIASLAVAIRDAIAAVKSDRVLLSLRALEQYRIEHGLEAMECLHLRHPSRGLIVTNLTRMPISDVDFGAGAPSGFVPYVEQSGGAAILPAADGVEIIYAPLSKS